MAFSIGDAFLTISPSLATGFEQQLRKQVFSAVRDLPSALENVGRQLTTKVTLPIAIGSAANIQQFSQLDAKLTETTSIMARSTEQADRFFEEFRVGVSEITDDVGLFEQTVSEGLYEAISAGVPRNDAAEFMRTAGEAAVAGAIDIQVAVDGLTTAVNAFYQGDFSRVGEAADILFRGVAQGKITLDEFATQIATAAPLAQAAGVAFEEFVAAIAAMTLSGTTASEAVTNVRAALTGLLRPSEEMTALFQDAGFATQDLAVQTLGMAAALDVVVQATDGEVGAMIKLLGGAEAANAALQIAGEGAAQFQAVLADTSTATGAMEAAFDIMDESSSRVFTRLFTQFGRIGTSFGEIGSTVVIPLTKGLTSVLGVFNDVVDSIARGPTTLKLFTSGVVGLTAAIGPLVLIGSKLLTLFGVRLGISLASRGGLAGVLQTLTAGTKLLAGGLLSLVARTTAWFPALDRLTDRLNTLKGRALEPVMSTLGRGGLAIAGVTAALVAGGLAWEAYKRHIEETQESVQFATTQTERLAENLGLVTKPMQNVAQAADELGESMQFRIDNLDLITQLEEGIEQGLGTERLIQVGYELIALGNSPEEVFTVIQQLANAANIELPVSFTVEDLSPAQFVESVSSEIEVLVGQWDEFMAQLARDRERITSRGALLQAAYGDTRIENELIGRSEEIATQLARIFTDIDPEVGLQFLSDINESLGVNTEQAELFNEAFLNALNVEGDLDLSFGFLGLGVTTFTDTVDMLIDNNVVLESSLDGVNRNIEYVADNFELRAAQMRAAAAIPIDPPITEEQLGVVASAQEELMATVDEVTTRIAERHGELRASFINTIPMFGEFAGAATNASRTINEGLETEETVEFFDPDALIANLDAYTEALTSWFDVSTSLIGRIPEELRAKLDEMPIEQQAALANLAEEAPGKFDEVIAAYERAFGEATGTADEKFKQELPGLVEQGNAEVLNKMHELEFDMQQAGIDVATAFENGFGVGSFNWASMAADEAAKVTRAVESQFEIHSPSRVFERIGQQVAAGFQLGVDSAMRAPSLSGVSSLTGSVNSSSQEINVTFVNPTAHDVVEDSRRAIGVMRTAAFNQRGRLP